MWRGQLKIVTSGDYSSLRRAVTEAGGCRPVSNEGVVKSTPIVSINAFGTHDGGIDQGLSHSEQCAHQV